MKLDNHISLQDKIEIHAQKEVEKQKVLFQSTSKHKGHTMYEIDCTTGEIIEAKYKEERYVMVKDICLITGKPTGKTSHKLIRDIDCQPNCIYIAALNKSSAKKKFLKWVIENTIKKDISTKKQP